MLLAPCSLLLAAFPVKLTCQLANSQRLAAAQVYAKQNGGQYDMAIDGVFAIPLTPQFYKDLFANATKPAPVGLGVSSMVMFEQDFLSYWMDGAGAGPWHYTLANATMGFEFLKQQSDAAVEVNATIQCTYTITRTICGC